jgi:hypothetical protein
VPGASITSHAAFVLRARNAKSMLPSASSTCTIASARRPSVPGRTASHSSAIAE